VLGPMDIFCVIQGEHKNTPWFQVVIKSKLTGIFLQNWWLQLHKFCIKLLDLMYLQLMYPQLMYLQLMYLQLMYMQLMYLQLMYMQLMYLQLTL